LKGGKKMKNKQILTILILIMTLIFTVSFATAWTWPWERSVKYSPSGSEAIVDSNSCKADAVCETRNIQAESARISGNVGIGTDLATQKLEVAGNVKAAGICIGDDCRTSWPSGGTSGSGTTDYLPVWTGSASLGDSPIYIKRGNGLNYVGIGTSDPLGGLHVGDGRSIVIDTTGGIQFRSITNGVPVSTIYKEPSTNNLKFNVLQGAKFYFSTGGMNQIVMYDGKIGIGNINPGQSLDVAGTARMSALAGSGTAHVCANANGVLIRC
jgi:hypothetical protein